MVQEVASEPEESEEAVMAQEIAAEPVEEETADTEEAPVYEEETAYSPEEEAPVYSAAEESAYSTDAEQVSAYSTDAESDSDYETEQIYADRTPAIQVEPLQDVYKRQGYIPYLITVLLYLACSNTLAPLFGFKPPTKDLNVTAALAIMSMCLIEFSGIKKNGMKHWVKHFAEPIPIVAPIMILEIVIRPLSLCMRLFGNMLAGFVVKMCIRDRF